MKPTDDEVRDRNALAAKLSMALKERVAFLEQEARSKRPNLERIRRECEAQREVIDAELAKYDAKHGTETEWVATESRLRQFIDKQGAYIDELHKVVQWEQAQCRQRDALLAGAVPIVQTLMALCEAHGVAIPDELMGVLQ
jgi:hypothetical protein